MYFVSVPAVFVHYQLDNSLERNPYAIWLQGGKPNFPPYKLLQKMRDAAVSACMCTKLVA